MTDNTNGGGDIPSPSAYALELHDGKFGIMIPAADDMAANDYVIASRPQIEEHYRLHPNADVNISLPQGYFGVDDPDPEGAGIEAIGAPGIILITDRGHAIVYRLHQGARLPDDQGPPKKNAAIIRRPGERFRVHRYRDTLDEFPTIHHSVAIDEQGLALLAAYNAALRETVEPEPEPVVTKALIEAPPEASTVTVSTRPNPLRKYSLRGHSHELARKITETKLLLDFCRQGEITLLYGQSNFGKSLIVNSNIITSIREGRLNADDVIYCNVDDSLAGLAEKTEIFEQFGAHMLAQGFAGFRTKNLIPDLLAMIEHNQADGVFIILDTAKKFCSIMDKKRISDFAEILRQFVLKGGSVLLLAHTNKRPDADGRPVPSGTADLTQDADCSFLITTRIALPDSKECVVILEREKLRGPVPEKIGYMYSTAEGISYQERLFSVRRVDPDEYRAEIAQPSSKAIETDIIRTIEQCIADGFTQKMKLAYEVVERVGAGRHTVIRTVNQFAGDDPAVHRWTVTRLGDNHTLAFQLLEGRPPI